MLGLAALGLATPSLAAGWDHYVNARYGFEIDVPPDFSPVAEADNGDGGTSTAVEGNAELRFWGSLITDADFASAVAWRIGQDKADGWEISYQRAGAGFASWSGSHGARIMYQRALAYCDDRSAYFRIEYDRSALAAFNPIIQHLVKSLKAGDTCD